MRSKTSDWFLCKVRYGKTQEDGQIKNVTESYIVDALSFTEAEATITKEMTVYMSGDFKVVDIKPCKFHEIFFSDSDKDDKWYKVKLQFISIDEKTEKEKRSNVTYLLQGSTTNGAQKAIDEVMGGTMIDYVVVSVSETKVLDVFEHEILPDEQKKAENAKKKEAE